MTVARQGLSFTMTAPDDAYTGVISVLGINFQGTGLTAGHRLLITDTAGSVIADYIVEGTSDNADLINGRAAQFYQGIKLGPTTPGGTWVVTIICE